MNRLYALMLLLLPLGVNAQKNARIDKIELHLTFGIIMTEYSIPCKDYHTNFQSDIDTFTIVQKDSVQRIVEMIGRTAGVSNYKKNMNCVNTRGIVYLWDKNTIIDSMCLGSPIGMDEELACSRVKCMSWIRVLAIT